MESLKNAPGAPFSETLFYLFLNDKDITVSNNDKIDLKVTLNVSKCRMVECSESNLVFLFSFSLPKTEHNRAFIQELKNSLYQSSYGGSTNKSEEG
jgi:hypothetical protein